MPVAELDSHRPACRAAELHWRVANAALPELVSYGEISTAGKAAADCIVWAVCTVLEWARLPP
jgi:hypothetical protein